MNYSLERGVNFFDTAELYAVPMKPETRGDKNLLLSVINKNNQRRYLGVKLN